MLHSPSYDELFQENKRLKERLNSQVAAETINKDSTFENLAAHHLLEDSNDLAKLAIDAANAGTIVLDIKKDKLIWDKRSLEIYGLTKENFGGNFSSWAELVVPEDLVKIQPEIDRQLKEGDRLDLRYKITRSDGEIRNIWANASIIRNDSGDAILLSGLHFDETEIVQSKVKLEMAFRKLKKLNTRKDKFFTILAHDLRNPFNAIKTFLGYIIENLDSYNMEQLKEELLLIHSSANNAYKLLEDILLWEQAQSNNIPFQPTKINLKQVISEAIETLSLEASAKAVSIENSISNEVKVFADKNMISTILRNIITNSIKYSSKGRTIFINGIEKEEHFSISIIDQGIGINSEKLTQLFDIANTKSSLGTSDEHGSGLGLLICKEFIETNGGKINVQSTVNVGTEVILTLPLTNIIQL